MLRTSPHKPTPCQLPSCPLIHTFHFLARARFLPSQAFLRAFSVFRIFSSSQTCLTSCSSSCYWNNSNLSLGSWHEYNFFKGTLSEHPPIALRRVRLPALLVTAHDYNYMITCTAIENICFFRNVSLHRSITCSSCKLLDSLVSCEIHSALWTFSDSAVNEWIHRCTACCPGEKG